MGGNSFCTEPGYSLTSLISELRTYWGVTGEVFGPSSAWEAPTLGTAGDYPNTLIYDGVKNANIYYGIQDSTLY